MKRILIIEVNWLGDVLFTTPAIRAIRESNPSVFISCLTVPRCVEMLAGNPHIDEIMVFDEENMHRGIFGKLSIISKLRKRRFDIAVSFHRSMGRMLIAYFAGIPKRVGYYTRKRFWLLTDAVPVPQVQPHRVEYFLDITRRIEADTNNKDYEFHISEEDIIGAGDILKKGGIVAGEDFFLINPGGNWPPKRWPAIKYAQLCQRLKALYAKRIVITGAEKDIPLAEEIIRISKGSAVSICGKTTLKELGAIMRRAEVVVANDSGPMHIAVSQRTPTIALFGPTSPKITGPYGSGNYIVLHKWFDCETPCYSTCQEYRCMEAISVEDVIEAVDKLIGIKN